MPDVYVVRRATHGAACEFAADRDGRTWVDDPMAALRFAFLWDAEVVASELGGEPQRWRDAVIWCHAPQAVNAVQASNEA